MSGLLIGMPTMVLAQTKIEPQGFYRAKPGLLGEANRMNVWHVDGTKYRVSISTIYCAYAFSKDCANARYGSVEFEAVLSGKRLTFSDQSTKCFVQVDFKPKIAFVTQTGLCPNLPRSDAGDLYYKKGPIPEELRP